MFSILQNSICNSTKVKLERPVIFTDLTNFSPNAPNHGASFTLKSHLMFFCAANCCLFFAVNAVPLSVKIHFGQPLRAMKRNKMNIKLSAMASVATLRTTHLVVAQV